MKLPLSPIVLGALACAGLVLAPVTSAPAAEAKGRPVFLYSRYFNAAGEQRYLPDGNYKDVLTRLRAEFDVRVHAEPLTAKSLAGVNVLLIANPSDQAVGTNPAPPHVAAADIAALTRFVEQGGGLIVMSNQENHNVEVEDTNRLLARFGLQLTNRYTDIKRLVLPKETPVIGGLRWAYYSGNLAVPTPGHPARPRALVSNDLTQKPVKGERDEPGALLAVAEPGRGRVVLVTDSGWIIEDSLSGKGVGGPGITEQDNWEIFRRLAHWAAGSVAQKK